MTAPNRLHEHRIWAWELAQKAGVPLLDHEHEQIEVADLGLGELEKTGLQILTLGATQWLAAKLLILRPFQFFPQHRHPPSLEESYPGKTELFRGQYGSAFLYIPGPATSNPQASPPIERKPYCTVWQEVVLGPGQQHVCPPDTWHWFQAGADGAVIWSISSKATDAADVFNDPDVRRF